MYTRKDRLDNKCTHSEYYAQFVTDATINKVVKSIGKSNLLKSTDEHLNDIPLAQWDAITMLANTSATLKQCGDYLTLAGQVCIAKEAARQFIESSRDE